MLETIMKILSFMSIITFLFTKLPIITIYIIQIFYQLYFILYICLKYIILYGIILLCLYIIYKINYLITIIKCIIKNYDKIKELINSS